tara:strand:- start:36 stop:656 length:621 start_codon:yes stop_codon:yes gene_type:complete
MTDSIYDQLNAYGTVAKQRMVETFSGDALDTDRWNLGGTSTPTATMADEVDGGIKVSTSGSLYNFATLTFNNIHPFNPASCAMIFVSQRDNANAKARHGLSHLGATAEAFTEHHSFLVHGESANIKFETGNGTNTSTDSGVNVTLNAVLNKIEMGASDGKYSDATGLKVTKTTNLPTTSQQPYLYHFANTAAVWSINYRYCEVYNT